MTDPEVADKTYIEPITPEIVEKIIKKENHAQYFNNGWANSVEHSDFDGEERYS